jgi:hypothetical protein
MRTIFDPEFTSVSALPAPERYGHFVKQVVDFEAVWSLRNASGWVLSGDADGRELVPVWPHARYAAACATDEWADCEPIAIPLDQWLSRWLPGIQRDQTLVAVFPVPGVGEIPTSADRLLQDLEAELQHYE